MEEVKIECKHMFGPLCAGCHAREQRIWNEAFHQGQIEQLKEDIEEINSRNWSYSREADELEEALQEKLKLMEGG